SPSVTARPTASTKSSMPKAMPSKRMGNMSATQTLAAPRRLFGTHRGTGFAGPQVLPPVGGRRSATKCAQPGGELFLFCLARVLDALDDVELDVIELAVLLLD